MTAFIPTTRVTVERAELAADTWGDVRPSTVDLVTGVPAAITEGVSLAGARHQLTHQPVNGRGGVIEEYTIRLRPGTDVTEDDRLRDERTGAVYQVRSVFNPQSVAGLSDIRVIAIRTGAASISG